MPLRGPTFATGLEGSDAIDVRPERPNEAGVGSDVWVTFGRSGGATRYDLSDMSVKSVLTVPSHLRLTAPVVYDPKLGLDVCVVNNNQLLAFDAVAAASNGTKLETLLLQQGAVADLGRRTKAVDVLLSPAPHAETYVLLEDGQLQPTSFLMANKDGLDDDGPTPKGSRRFDTRLFHVNGRTWASHAYRTTSAAAGSACVKICSLLIDPETCMCKQKPFRTLELEGNVVSATLLDSTVVYAVDDGRVFASGLFDEDDKKKKKKRKLTLKGGRVSLSRASFVSRLDDDGKVAVLGNKEGDGEEGQAVIVVDVNVGRCGFVVDGVAVKSVVQSNNGKRLSCHGGNRILFKHGQRIAFIVVDNLPADLADFVGKRGFLLKDDDDDDDEEEEEEQLGQEASNWQRVNERSQSMQICDVLPAVLSAGSVSGAVDILDTFSDIPELCVLNLMEMVLVADGDGNATVLSRLFQVRITETLMLPHLKRSQFDLAKRMLGRVLDEVKAEAGRGDDDFDDRFDRLLVWIGLILNAHCCNFLLAKDVDEECARLLEDALETVELVESCVRAMETTMSMVQLLRDNTATTALLLQPDRCCHVDDDTYGIEMVEL